MTAATLSRRRSTPALARDAVLAALHGGELTDAVLRPLATDLRPGVTMRALAEAVGELLESGEVVAEERRSGWVGWPVVFFRLGGRPGKAVAMPERGAAR